MAALRLKLRLQRNQPLREINLDEIVDDVDGTVTVTATGTDLLAIFRMVHSATLSILSRQRFRSSL